jgi:hypothetical protein
MTVAEQRMSWDPNVKVQEFLEHATVEGAFYTRNRSFALLLAFLRSLQCSFIATYLLVVRTSPALGGLISAREFVDLSINVSEGDSHYGYGVSVLHPKAPPAHHFVRGFNHNPNGYAALPAGKHSSLCVSFTPNDGQTTMPIRASSQ